MVENGAENSGSKLSSKNKVMVGVYLDELKEPVQIVALAKNISVSRVIRNAVRSYLTREVLVDAYQLAKKNKV